MNKKLLVTMKAQLKSLDKLLKKGEKDMEMKKRGKTFTTLLRHTKFWTHSIKP
jgi:hypothetical protein